MRDARYAAFPAGAEIAETWQRSPAQLVRAGDALRVRGIRGKVTFRHVVVLADGRTSVAVVSPTYGFHDVRPERVRAVARRSGRPARYGSPERAA